VGYGWIDALRDHAEVHVSDEIFAAAAERFPYNAPTSKEAYLYRAIFEEHYPQDSAARTVPGGPSIACSTERAIAWDASFKNRCVIRARADAVTSSSFNMQHPYFLFNTFSELTVRAAR